MYIDGDVEAVTEKLAEYICDVLYVTARPTAKIVCEGARLAWELDKAEADLFVQRFLTSGERMLEGLNKVCLMLKNLSMPYVVVIIG